MSTLAEIEQAIESVLLQPPYGVDPQQRHSVLLALFKKSWLTPANEIPDFETTSSNGPSTFVWRTKFLICPTSQWASLRQVHRSLWLALTMSSVP